MVKIRLFRTGAKHKPAYRVVAQDSQKKRNGKTLEVIGYCDPKTKPPTLKINKEKLEYWLNHGARLSEGARKLIQNEKTS